MGGEIYIDDLNKIPADVLNRSPKDRVDWKAGLVGSLKQIGDIADRESANDAIKMLVDIVLETTNLVLAESCCQTIKLLLDEYAPSRKKDPK